MQVPILDLTGSPHDLGFVHGKAFEAAIRHYAEERVALAGGAAWTGREATRAEVLALAEACLVEHRAYAPDLVEELEGMAAATDLTVAELIVVGGVADFGDAVANGGIGTIAALPGVPLETTGADDCTAFLVPASRMKDGRAALGQTWDMHEGSTDHLVLLRGRPDDGPAFHVYTTAGAVGMIGMNQAGVSVGINNLMGADGRVGVTWPFVVRKMLQADAFEGAVAALRGARLAGGHNYIDMDASGRGVNVEAMATSSHETWVEDGAVAHTNHCLVPETIDVQRPREPESQADSEARLRDAQRLLDRHDLTIEDLQQVTADTTHICHRGVAPRFVGTCGGVIMRPGTRELWAVKGMPSEGAYERFVVGHADA